MTQQAMNHLLAWASDQPKDVQRTFAIFYAEQVPSEAVTIQDMEQRMRDLRSQ